MSVGPGVCLEVETLVEDVSGRGKLEERQHWCGGGGWDDSGQTWGRKDSDQKAWGVWLSARSGPQRTYGGRFQTLLQPPVTLGLQ